MYNYAHLSKKPMNKQSSDNYLLFFHYPMYTRLPENPLGRYTVEQPLWDFVGPRPKTVDRSEIVAMPTKQESHGFAPDPSEIVYKNLRFLIINRPTDDTAPYFIEEFKKRNVKDVVRVCEASYRIEKFECENIRIHDWQFQDGSPPPVEIIKKWFELLRTRFADDPDCCIAVHCVAGLGRAPALVAVALLELGMTFEDAVELIRQKRRGAINTKQLTYLASYRPKNRLKFKTGQSDKCLLQ